MPEPQTMRQASGLNAVWIMDFVSDALANGRRLGGLIIAVDHGIVAPA